jgi:hypothetical protein
MERKARNAGGYTARAAEARGTRDPAKPLQFCPPAEDLQQQPDSRPKKPLKKVEKKSKIRNETT